MDFNNYSNAGFSIIASELVDQEETRDYFIVLGEKKTRFGMEYVTWQGHKDIETGELSFYWGHYFNKESDARIDYHERVLAKLRRTHED